MLSCRQLTECITDYLEGHLGAGKRLQLRWHLLRCAPCRAYLAHLRLMLQTLGALPPEPVSAAVHQTLMDSFRHVTTTRPPLERRRVWAARSAAACEWLLGAWKGWLASATAVAVLALAAVFVTAAPGPLGHGGKCVLVELLTAAVPIAAVVGLALASHSRLSAGLYVAGGCAGSLVGYAHVQAHCALSRALPHALVFHVGGVLVAALLAAAVAAVMARLPAMRRPSAP